MHEDWDYKAVCSGIAGRVGLPPDHGAGDKSGLQDTLCVPKPFFPGDPGLAKDTDKKIRMYLSPVRIRDCQDQIAFDHVRMPAAPERAVKTKRFQPAGKFRSGDRWYPMR